MRKIILLLIPFFLVFLHCNESTNSNLLDSDNYATKEERVAILKKEILHKSDIIDAEFELFNVNGFSNNSRTTIPGASSWDYKLALKVTSTDIDKWTDGMLKGSTNNHNLDWIEEITVNRKMNWVADSSPELYFRQKINVIVVVYRNEGILFKRVMNK